MAELSAIARRDAAHGRRRLQSAFCPLLRCSLHCSPMAVFTEVSLADAQALVDRLGLGPVTALRGIASGIENTN